MVPTERLVKIKGKKCDREEKGEKLRTVGQGDKNGVKGGTEGLGKIHGEEK